MAVPVAPTNLTLRNADTSKLAVSWTAPANPNPALSSYTVRYRTSADPGAVPPVAAGAWTTTTGVALALIDLYTITNLSDFQSYDVQVAGVNADGTGAYSASLAARTLESDTMAILNTDLTEIYFGLEAANAPGTLVTATRLVPVTEASYQAMQVRENLDEMRGIMADYEDLLTQQYSQLQITQVLDFENLIAALMCGLENETPTGATPNVWTFTPGRTAPVALRTATINVASTDGSAATNNRRFGNARPTAITIAVGDTGYATLQTTWMGRASDPLAAVPSVAAMARTPIPVGLFQVFIDDDWASLGTTAYGQLRNANIELTPGLSQAFTLSGRATLDPAGWYRSRPQGVCALTLNHDEDVNPELGHFRDGDLRFVRLQAATGTGNTARRLRIDMCVRYVETPDELARAERQHTLSFQGQLRADTTAANNLLQVEATNGLASW